MIKPAATFFTAMSMQIDLLRLKQQSIFMERPFDLSMSGRHVVLFTRPAQTQSVLPTPGFHPGRRD